MALITINDLTQTLADTRASLISAANGDGMVSRADLKQLLEQTENALEKRFIEFFYSFIIKLENRPNMRVTEAIIDQGINFIQEQIIPNFEIQTSFMAPTRQKIAEMHESAYPMAMELIRFTSDRVMLSPKEVSEQIAALSEGLFFDDLGSEAAIPIETFFLEHPNRTLTPSSFVTALGVHPESMEGEVSRFEPADRILLSFIDKHVSAGLDDKASAVVDLMQTNLSDLKMIVRGEEFNPVFKSEHPAYIVGIGQNGNLAGFQTAVIWT